MEIKSYPTFDKHTFLLNLGLNLILYTLSRPSKSGPPDSYIIFHPWLPIWTNVLLEFRIVEAET